jgi:hypothetical protein
VCDYLAVAAGNNCAKMEPMSIPLVGVSRVVPAHGMSKALSRFFGHFTLLRKKIAKCFDYGQFFFTFLIIGTTDCS